MALQHFKHCLIQCGLFSSKWFSQWPLLTGKQQGEIIATYFVADSLQLLFTGRQWRCSYYADVEACSFWSLHVALVLVTPNYLQIPVHWTFCFDHFCLHHCTKLEYLHVFANQVPTENILHLKDTLPPTSVRILKCRGINTYLSSILHLAFFYLKTKAD